MEGIYRERDGRDDYYERLMVQLSTIRKVVSEPVPMLENDVVMRTQLAIMQQYGVVPPLLVVASNGGPEQGKHLVQWMLSNRRYGPIECLKALALASGWKVLPVSRVSFGQTSLDIWEEIKINPVQMALTEQQLEVLREHKWKIKAVPAQPFKTRVGLPDFYYRHFPLIASGIETMTSSGLDTSSERAYLRMALKRGHWYQAERELAQRALAKMSVDSILDHCVPPYMHGLSGKTHGQLMSHMGKYVARVKDCRWLTALKTLATGNNLYIRRPLSVIKNYDDILDHLVAIDLEADQRALKPEQVVKLLGLGWEFETLL